MRRSTVRCTMRAAASTSAATLVCGDKARHAQFRPAEITHDDDQAVGRFVREQLPQNRPAGRRRRSPSSLARNASPCGPSRQAYNGAWRRSNVCATLRAGCGSPLRRRRDRRKREICCSFPCRSPRPALRWSDRYRRQASSFHFGEEPVPPDVRRERFLCVERQPDERGAPHDVVFGHETPENASRPSCGGWSPIIQ